MTVKIPRSNMMDKLLATLGKRRAVFIPDLKKELGPYVNVNARKEPFLQALLRPQNASLPDGWVYVDDLVSTEEDG